MRNKILFLLLFTCITFGANAEGYRINVSWESLADSSIYLVHYYNGGNYIDDTLRLDSSGKGFFEGNEKLHEGLYILYHKSNFFDFLIGDDQTFDIEKEASNSIGDLKITGAAESVNFLNYQNMLREKQQEKKELSEVFKSEDEEQKKEAKEKLIEIDNEMSSFIEKEISKNGQNMYATFLKLSKQIRIPDSPYDKNNPKYDSLTWFHNYNYRRDHFFDHVDFTDERVVFTPIFKSKLNTYFQKIIIQSPDSIIPQALKIISKAENNEKMLQIVSQYFLNSAAESKIMGMDAVFVAIADAVYLNGKATWLQGDTIVLRKIAEEAYLSRPNLIGNKAPDLTMENIDGIEENLYTIDAEYTILAFYEYNCGHCKKDIPALYNDVYLKFLDHHIEVIAICMNDDKAKWTEFVEEKELAGWHHWFDPAHHSKFRFKYNVKTAPTIFLLDKDKKIIAKKIDNENISRLLSALLNEN